MNLSHLRYAVEIEKTKSITKAAENLYMGQPNLSRAIKELEEEMGFQIFSRSPKGVYPTVQGAEFLRYAKKILSMVNEMEQRFSPKSNGLSFSASVIGAGYIMYAFSNMVKHLDLLEAVEIRLEETGNIQTIHNILENNFNLGIIRYRLSQENFYKNLLKEKKLSGKPILEFQHVVLLSKIHPLANRQDIILSDLSNYIEICNQYFNENSHRTTHIINEDWNSPTNKHIYISEGSNRYDLLSALPTTYTWDSPTPSDILKRYSLVQVQCNNSKDIYKDILIYKHGYQLSELDKLFIAQLDLSIKNEL